MGDRHVSVASYSAIYVLGNCIIYLAGLQLHSVLPHFYFLEANANVSILDTNFRCCVAF